MDDAARAVILPDPEMIEVGDGIWQGPQGRGLAQGAVRPVGVVEVLVCRSAVIRWRWFQIRVRSNSSRRQLPIHRSMIEFIRAPGRRANDSDPGRLEHGIERLREAGVPVMQDELHSCPGVL